MAIEECFRYSCKVCSRQIVREKKQEPHDWIKFNVFIKDKDPPQVRVDICDNCMRQIKQLLANEAKEKAEAEAKEEKK